MTTIHGNYIIIVDVQVAQPSPSIEYVFELLPASAGICIYCTFLDDLMLTDCIVVVHQRISHLSSSGLMNIESSHKFNRSGDTAYGCIEGFDVERYQVGVIGGSRKEATIKPTSKLYCDYIYIYRETKWEDFTKTYCIAGKFGANISCLHIIIRMAIPY